MDFSDSEFVGLGKKRRGLCIEVFVCELSGGVTGR